MQVGNLYHNQMARLCNATIDLANHITIQLQKIHSDRVDQDGFLLLIGDEIDEVSDLLNALTPLRDLINCAQLKEMLEYANEGERALEAALLLSEKNGNLVESRNTDKA